MDTRETDRIITTSTTYARKNYLYIQEIGTVKEIKTTPTIIGNLDSYLFIIVIDGQGSITSDDMNYDVSSGDCAFVDCTGNYSLVGTEDEPCTCTWVYFYGKQAIEFYKQYSTLNSSPVFHPLNVKAFVAIMNEMNYLQKTNDPAKELISHKYLTDLVTLIYTENLNISESHFSIGKKFDHIRAYLDEHYREKISLDELSDKFFISKYYLSREFKRIYGINLISYVAEKRTSFAKNLLRFSEKSVEQIARDTGFPDTGYFIKVFKKEESLTPLEYRKKWTK